MAGHKPDLIAATLEASLLTIQAQRDLSPEGLEERVVRLERLCVETIRMVNHLADFATESADALEQITTTLMRRHSL